MGIERGTSARKLADMGGIKWVVGGHGLGGVAASKYVFSDSGSDACGLLFWASLPNARINLASRKGLQVVDYWR